MLHSVGQPIGKLSSVHRTGRGQCSVQFQRITRRDNKAFLNYQCKEMEGNSRMEKTIDLFKKIIDTKGTFRAKI